jgi:hypothetical protein
MISALRPSDVAAPAAHDALSRRPHAGARLARERARGARLALVSCAMFAAALGLAVEFGWAPHVSDRRTADPEAQRFAQTRTGRIRFTTADGLICREFLFHNQTGRLSDAGTDCDALTESVETSHPAVDPGGRFISIRDAFANR